MNQTAPKTKAVIAKGTASFVKGAATEDTTAPAVPWIVAVMRGSKPVPVAAAVTWSTSFLYVVTLLFCARIRAATREEAMPNEETLEIS